jgi:hypothetical protein
MPTIEVSVRRVSVVSSRPFDEIVRRLTATIGHPEMHAFHLASRRQRPPVILKTWSKGRSDRRT